MSRILRGFLLLAALSRASALSPVAAVQEDDFVETIEAVLETAQELLRARDEDAARACLEELAASIAEREGLASDEEVAVLERIRELAGDRRMLPLLLTVEGRILAALEARLEKTHPDLQKARQDLALTKFKLGDAAGALVLEEAVLAAREASLEPDAPELLRAREDVAWLRSNAGDVRGALELQEAVVVARRRREAPDSLELLSSQHTLAWFLKEAGDLEGARALQEVVLEARERIFADDHPEVVAARHNLAWMKLEVGDLEGALVLQEEVLEAYERMSSPKPEDLLWARSNLAVTKREMGDYEGAFTLQQAVLEAREKVLPQGHKDLLATRHNVAGLLRALNRLDEAEELGEAVLATWQRELPEDHPDRLKAGEGLAMTKRALGEAAGAAALFEAVVAARQRLLPADHPDLLRARELLIWTRVEAGELEATTSLLEDQREGILARHLQALSSSPREACAAVGSEAQRVDQILFLEDGGDRGGSGAARLFVLLETRRHAATAPATGCADPELDELWREAARARSELNDLVLGGASAEELPAWRERMRKLSLERDKSLAAVRRKLAERGRIVEAIRPEALAERLSEGAVAVGYQRYVRLGRDPDSSRVRETGPALLAMVVDPGGTVHRVELGPIDELEALVQRWRVESTEGRGIGLGSAEGSPADPLEAGRRLRARILDPVLAAAGLLLDATTADDTRGPEVFVALDDFLHLVPLDALPLEAEGLVVGDRWRIRNEVSFARLLEPRRLAAGKGLLAVGDVDYEAESAGSGPEKTIAAASAPLRGGERPGSFSRWEELPGTKEEVVAIADLFDGTFGEKASLLRRGNATKAALLEHARGKRFVHVATHGWFAPETILSSLDAGRSAGLGLRSSTERTVEGLAPMTLCGLCLSGANRGRDDLGRVPGLLTAEELAGFDLSACELAVLSACQTNVGLRRAGQGILSLQAALHSAGARSAITSLWRVSDAHTRELMERFYRHLWTEKAGKSEALWQAKREMRAQGHPFSAWAGWILSGDP